jgi:hypothetical protein
MQCSGMRGAAGSGVVAAARRGRPLFRSEGGRRQSRKVALLGVLCRPDVQTPTSASMSSDTMTKTGRAPTLRRLGVGRVAAAKATRPSPNVTT